MEKARLQIDNLKAQYSEHSKNFEKYNAEIASIQERITSCEDRLRHLSIEIVDKRKTISRNEETSESTVTDVDIMIERLQLEIDKIDIQAEKYNQGHKAVIKKAEKTKQRFQEVITESEETLKQIFCDYAKKYFDEDVDLQIIRDSKPRGLEIELDYFIPKLDSKERRSRTRVSTSEANILEYVFRISLLQLYFERTGTRPFCILETSEGSFDIDKTIRLATTLRSFGQNDFPIIIITNLSKEDFIVELMDGHDMVRRTFLILDYARMVQKASALVEQKIKALGLRRE